MRSLFILRHWVLAASLLLIQLPACASEASEGVILVFGDSLSAAYGMDESDGWVTLLENRINEQGLPYRVVNTSVSGETTSGGLARLPDVLSHHEPDYVILELGGNDGLRGLPVDRIRDNLEQMISLIRDSGARVLLAGIRLPPNYGPRYTQPFFEQFGEIAEARNVTLLPSLLEGIASRSSLMQDDGIHPTAEAQPLIVDNVWPVLLRLLEGRAEAA